MKRRPLACLAANEPEGIFVLAVTTLVRNYLPTKSIAV
jgi:hypothetical protein